jgi:hypothetical protein
VRLAAITTAGPLAAAAVALSGGSARADATPTGIEVGLRTGYAIPAGDIQQSQALGDTVGGTIPIWIDAGYRFHPNAMIGAFFQYGISLWSSPGGDGKGCGGDCSASDIMFGLQFHYHLAPDETLDPWGGMGVGYEILVLDNPGTGNSAGVGGMSYSGFQFVNLQIGADYKLTPSLGVGPFMMFSLGEYSGCSYTQLGNCTIQSSALHEWFTLGIRVAYEPKL